MRYETTIRSLGAPEFDRLVRHELASAVRVATVVLGSAEGADDVVQVAMERAWSAIATYEAERPFRPWFLRIVANTARNDRRQRGPRAALDLRAHEERGARRPIGRDGGDGAFDREQLLAGLNRLDVEDRTVIALRYFEQLGEAEMAEVMSCAPGTIKSRLARARGRLRVHLEEGEANG